MFFDPVLGLISSVDKCNQWERYECDIGRVHPVGKLDDPVAN